MFFVKFLFIMLSGFLVISHAEAKRCCSKHAQVDPVTQEDLSLLALNDIQKCRRHHQHHHHLEPLELIEIEKTENPESQRVH